MTQFKVGDKVKLVNQICSEASKGDIVTITQVTGDNISFKTDAGRRCFHTPKSFELVTPREKTWETLSSSDVLEHADERYDRKVVQVTGLIIVTEDADDNLQKITLVSELKDDGWTIKQPTPTEKEEAPATINIAGKTYRITDELKAALDNFEEA